MSEEDMSTEQSTNNFESSIDHERALREWASEVKKGIESGEVQGAITARTSHRIDLDENGYRVRPGDYREEGGYNSVVILRGLNEDEASDLYNVFVQYDGNSGSWSHRDLDNHTLYVTAAKLDEVRNSVPRTEEEIKTLENKIGGKTILEFRYQQPKAEMISRGPAVKWVYLAVPDEMADDMLEMVQSGADPNAVREALAEVFTDKSTREFFDATLVKVEGDKPVIVKHPEVTKLDRASVIASGRSVAVEPKSSMDETLFNQPTQAIEIPRPPASPSPPGEPPEPPNPPDNGPETPSEPEPDYSDQSFEVLNALIKSKNISPQELSALLKERIKRTDDNQTFLNYLHTAARDILAKEGNTRDSREKIKQIAKDIESDTRYNEFDYEVNDQGIIFAAGLGLADRLVYLEALKSRKISKERLDAMNDRSVRTHFLRGVISKGDIDSDVRTDQRTGTANDTQTSTESVLHDIHSELRKQTEIQERIEPEVIRISPPEEKDKTHAWVAVVFDQIEKAELATRESQHVSYDTDMEKMWKAIARFVDDQVPEKMGHKHDELSEYYKNEHPDGIYLRERLQRYVRARQRLNDRFIETQKSQGGLTGYGVNTAELVQIEKIAPSLNDLEPGDLYLIIHSDDIFMPDLEEVKDQTDFEVRLENGSTLRKEAKEMLGNVDQGMTIWYTIGHNYDEPFAEGWPTFRDALNSDILWRRLQDLVRVEIESKTAGILAYQMMEATASIPFFDYQRESFQGNGELRDTMHKQKHLLDNVRKRKFTGSDAVYTAGRYFAPKIDKDEKEDDYLLTKPEPDLLKVNMARAVFPADSIGFKSELVGDFWHTATVYDIDRFALGAKYSKLTDEEIFGLQYKGVKIPYVPRKLISYVVDRQGNPTGSFKNIPILRMGRNAYIGYFQYNINLASRINNTLYKTVGVLKGDDVDPGVVKALKSVEFWNELDKSIIDIPKSCPMLNSSEFNARGMAIRAELKRRGNIPTDEIEKVSGVFSKADLKKYSDSPRLQDAIEDVLYTTDIAQKHRSDETRGAAKAWEEAMLNEIRLTKAVDVFWEGSVRRVKNLSPWYAINDQSPLKHGDVREILRALQQSGFVKGDWYKALEKELDELKFGPVHVRLPRRKEGSL